MVSDPDNDGTNVNTGRNKVNWWLDFGGALHPAAT
jgi:hypothetical protein